MIAVQTRPPYACVRQDGSPKRRFTRSYAEMVVKQINTSNAGTDRPLVNSYFCPRCQTWHVGRVKGAGRKPASSIP